MEGGRKETGLIVKLPKLAEGQTDRKERVGEM